jgi:hypothetical protein
MLFKIIVLNINKKAETFNNKIIEQICIIIKKMIMKTFKILELIQINNL